jgi:hypothetical protein
MPCRYPATALPFSDSAERGQVAHMPSLDGRCQFTHTMPFTCRDPAVASRGRFQKGIFVAWQGKGKASVNQTRPHCVNQMGKTQYKPLAERHGMCESAFCHYQHCSFRGHKAGHLRIKPYVTMEISCYGTCRFIDMLRKPAGHDSDDQSPKAAANWHVLSPRNSAWVCPCSAAYYRLRTRYGNTAFQRRLFATFVQHGGTRCIATVLPMWIGRVYQLNMQQIRGDTQNIPDWCRHLYSSYGSVKHR